MLKFQGTAMLVKEEKKSFYYFSMKMSERMNNGVKMITASNVANHIAITISVQIITITYFFQNRAALINMITSWLRSFSCSPS